jgi:uncharacterized protein YecE (DUF72 family)
MAAPVVGTAGWSLPRAEQHQFPGEGTHLERYARVLPGAEINVSFYRPVRPALYAKWAAGVPARFRFSVKVPRTVTHQRRLRDCAEPLDAFLAEVAALGAKLGCLLVQLPPSLAWDAAVAEDFLALLRARHAGPVALEPRHPTWFADAPEAQLVRHDVARVAADPARVPEAALPGGARSLEYHRLHGSPRIYYTPYDDAYLDALAPRLRAAARRGAAVWCVFDNTASGAALPNALALRTRLRGRA